MKIIFTLIVLFFSVELIAQKAGTLDYSFGDSGKVISKYFGNCYDVAVQSDNKIVCVGINDYLYQVVRYTPDGSLDSSFGNNGVINPVVSGGIQQAAKMLIQPDQKIVLAGFEYKNGIPTIVLMRFLSNGSFDNSFGINGVVDSTLGIGESLPYIALQSDGKIVVLGWYYPGFILLRYNTDGSLDESFGNNGEVLTTFGEGAVPTSIAIAPDGRIVTAGTYGAGEGYGKFLLARYNTDGTLDKTFGHGGVITTDFGKYGDAIDDIAIQPDGKIIAAGQTGLQFDFQNENVAIARYQTNGNLDDSFATAGKATVIFPGFDASARRIILQPDNKIVFAGEIYSLNYAGQDFALGRLLSNGELDSSFATNGETTINFGLLEQTGGLALQKNKILLAGTSYSVNDSNQQADYTLVRYNNDESQKQIIITEIRHWIQHHNGIEWNNMPNIKTYAVQRSIDGQQWTTINRQATVSGEQFAVNHYSDPTPPPTGTTYYRLQTTSTSNAVANSNVIAISNDDAIKISPNPAQNILHIEGLSSSQKTKITVVDFNGNIAISQQLSANSNSYNLNIASLHAGNYLLKIEMNDEVVTKQFVKD
jgi:uncharacterized delta-60 repeat protein